MENASLFDSSCSLERIDIPDADIRFVHQFFGPAQAQSCFARLHDETPWTRPVVRIWEKEHLQPRMSCWYGDSNAVYRFSGKMFHPLPWTTTLLDIRRVIQSSTGFHFNSVLLNLYRDEQDSIAMHSDNETERGPMPVIASLSLGATRLFSLKRRKNTATPVSIALTDGSLLIMTGRTQEHWLHGVRKERRAVRPRIDLTFRRILAI